LEEREDRRIQQMRGGDKGGWKRIKESEKDKGERRG
jgi:hypothetical protein